MERKKQAKNPRLKRHKRIRKKISGSATCPRLSVYRSLKHMYAQIIDDERGYTLVGVSTRIPEIRDVVNKGGNIAAAKEVGKLLAKKASEKNITTVVFDRGGYKYHGRVAALAESAREGGLQF